MSILVALIAFALMIIIHELGHFTVAKLSGIEVKEFAIGFGKQIFSIKKGETIYSLRCIPLGGFNDIDLSETAKGPNNFNSKPLFARILLLFAGSGFNLLSAFFALMLLLMVWGIPVPSSTIGMVQPNSVASSYLQPDDKILKINGETIDFNSNYDKFSQTVFTSSQLELEVERNSEIKTLDISKTENTPIGIVFEQEYKPVSFTNSIPYAAKAYITILKEFTNAIYRTVYSPEIQITDVVAGPIGVTQVMSTATEEMGGLGLIFTFVLISINLGIANLLPLPILDGGHIVFQIIEHFIGRPIPANQKRIIEYCGIGIIISIFLLGTYSDILRIIR